MLVVDVKPFSPDTHKEEAFAGRAVRTALSVFNEEYELRATDQ